MVSVWMIDEADVLVEGGPAIEVNIDSLGDVVEFEFGLVGNSEQKLSEGYVVTRRVCAAMRS